MINGGLINYGGCCDTTTQLALSDGLACYTGSFSGVTDVNIGHNLGSTCLVVEFQDHLGNLLLPDTWSIVNNNVINAEFTPAATGKVTIVACVESGFAPITGGVTLIEGLSGIVDLDSPNNSINIWTSGQVINLEAIFTPASGAVLEQTIEDITTLSGLIGGGSGTTVNGVSGEIFIKSLNDAIEVLTSGNTIWLSGLFTSTSGAIINQTLNDINILSGLIHDVSGAIGTGGVTDLNGLSGSINIYSLNDALEVTTSGNDIFLEVKDSGLSLSGIVDNVAGVSAALQTTTSTTLVEALSLNFDIVESGTYKVSWSMEASCNASNKECQFVVELDNDSVNRLMDIQTTFNVAAGNLPLGGFAQVELGSGNHFVDVDFRYADTGVQVAELERIGLEVWRLR
jgi:hypothetical protein